MNLIYEITVYLVDRRNYATLLTIFYTLLIELTKQYFIRVAIRGYILNVHKSVQ